MLLLLSMMMTTTTVIIITTTFLHDPILLLSAVFPVAIDKFPKCVEEILKCHGKKMHCTFPVPTCYILKF